MRFIPFLSMFLAFALLTAAPDVSDARPRHIPTMRHAKQQNTVQAQTADIREVQNSFFSITLPDGWKLQKPVVPVADRVSAVFMSGIAAVHLRNCLFFANANDFVAFGS